MSAIQQYVQEVPNDIEINDKFRHALDLMENSKKNIFVTGKAGTGKSTLLDYFRKTTRKNIAVLAPTGVAAVNIDGQTIHSFFGFKPDITADRVRKFYDEDVYNALDAVVIDEISMVRADLLDCVDRSLKLNRNSKKQFGGVQMIFIGDLYQLPPVVTSKEREIFRSHYKSQYFFDSRAFNEIDAEFIELEKIYRQKDEKFIKILNMIRNNSATDNDLEEINKRLNPSFEADSENFYISLTTTKDLAEEINERELSKLSTKEHTYTGKVKGAFDKNLLPTEMHLKLKTGSQVMLLNNDSANRWINGTVGKIVDIKKSKEGKDTIIVEAQNRKILRVGQHTWKMSRLVYNRETRKLESETTGSFTQYPIKLAWAVTIHKGQGKTFENVIIDIGRGTFTHGQTYVALSRCTKLDGIVLKKPIHKKHIFTDWRIVKFLTSQQYKISEGKMSVQDKIKLIEKVIKNKSKLSIVYLKANDEKSSRTIMPKHVGQMEYLGRKYIGVDAYCLKRKDDRVFRVDRILEMKEAEAESTS